MLVWINIVLVLVLILAVSQRFLRLPSSVVPSEVVVVQEDLPGPTFSSTSETGIDLIAKPISPSWPYTEFPRRPAGSVAWKQSSFDSPPYYTGKLRPLEWSVPSCKSCGHHNHGSSLREGLETNVAVESKQPPPVSDGPMPPPQMTKKMKEDAEEEEKNKLKATTTTIPPASAPTTAPAPTPAPAPTEAAAATAEGPKETEKGKPVLMNGSDTLKATINTGVVGGLVQQSADGLAKKPSSLPSETPAAAAAGEVSVAEKKPVLPASAIDNDMVKQRLQLLGDLGSQTQGSGEMAQSLYLLTLLQQNQQRSMELDKEINNNNNTTTTTTTTTTTKPPEEESRVKIVPS